MRNTDYGHRIGVPRRGLQDISSACYTCFQDENNVDHILVQCVYAREVWHYCFDALQLPIPRPMVGDTFMDWWLRHHNSFRKAEKRGIDSLVVGIAWSLWKQRNARVFNRLEQQLGAHFLASQILDEIKDQGNLHKKDLAVIGLQQFVREQEQEQRA